MDVVARTVSLILLEEKLLENQTRYPNKLVNYEIFYSTPLTNLFYIMFQQ